MPLMANQAVMRGALLVLASAACVAVDTIIARVVTTEVPALLLVFYRNLFGLVVVLPWLVRLGGRAVTSAHLRLHLLRAAIKTFGLGAFFFGLTRIPVAEATAIAFATPLFAAVGAALFLGESLRQGRLLAIFVGFAGVLVILRPGTAALDIGAVAVLGSAMALAAIGLLAKRLARVDRPDTILALTLILSVPLSLLVALPFWMTPSWPMLALMAAQGVLGAVSQFCFIRALRLADASLMMPLDFVRLPMVAVLGVVLLDQVPDRWTWIGAAIICVAILLLLRAGTRTVAPVATRGDRR